jgi:hypothetical protein
MKSLHKIITPLIALGVLSVGASILSSSCNSRTNQEAERQAPTLESCRPFRIGLPNLSIVDKNRDGLPDYIMKFEKDKPTLYAVSPYNTNIFHGCPLITAMSSQEVFEARQALEVSGKLNLQRAERDYAAWKQIRASVTTPSTNDLPYNKTTMDPFQVQETQ